MNVRLKSYLGGMKLKKQDIGRETTPTKGEMEVLQVLWKHGPSTVRFVHDTLNEHKEEAIQYTSTLKLMQVMTEKGMLERDETNMKHIYKPALEEDRTKGAMLERFVDNMYNGSVSSMMMALLGNDKTSKEELEKIKALLNNL
ncbi:MAG TPA: BlaI/MecI/CopY family transcriptional regulator [Chitinophagaceae bacterium]|nr:BlaI/MecI/CopY family transcriptional regulator [Chitinophagaceae bacterium]